jgi:hypothetical protein
MEQYHKNILEISNKEYFGVGSAVANPAVPINQLINDKVSRV